jgi:hypothetical protein
MEIEEHNVQIMNIMKNIGIDCDVFNCSDLECENNQHHNHEQICIPMNNTINASSNFIIPIQILTGKNKPGSYREVAHMDIQLEESCIYGQFCLGKSNPLLCPLNHHDLGKNIIKKGEYIPDLLCRYERPWKMHRGGVLCCMNPKCWYNHGVGRAMRITNNYFYKNNQ